VEAFVGRIDNDGVREGRLLWPGDDLAVVLTGSGRPVAYPMEAAELFGLKESDFRDLERGELLEQSLLDSPDPSVRRLAREMVQGVSGVRHMRLGASDVLVAHHPLPTLGWSLGLVLPLTDVLTSVQQTREAIVQARAALQRRFLQVLGVLLLLFGGLCAVYFQRRVHRPLQRLADAIEQTAIGQMDRRVAVDAPDELGRLGQAFNRMADNLQRHQEQLFRAEEMYHGIFLNAQEGIFQATGQGRLLAANPSMARMLGYDAPEALLRGVGDFRRDFPAEPGEWESVQERLERQGRVSSHRMRMRRRDGGRVWVLLSIGLMRAGDGDAGVYEGVVMDVTQWQAAADQVQALTRKLLKTQETERQRLAADLHDNVAQNLSSLKLACATLFDEHPEVPADLRRRVEAMGNILRQSINDVRDLAYGLRPPTLDQLGLARAVQQHCQEVAENTGLAIRFRARDAHEGRLDPEVEINVYRLAQEALRNVVRHAQAREALVELGRDNGELRLVVQDDGKGFHVSTGLAAAMERRRMGLHGMSQRAELLHGALRIESSPGQGTRVEALVPLERKGRGNEGDDERGVAGG
jgi:PAS domain S-box-containing protein